MLELKKIEFAYGEKFVLQNFNLTFEKATSYVLYGKSGSGKSTLLNIIAGILAPKKGEIIFEGKTLGHFNETALDKYRKENIGIVFQNFHLIKSLTLLENILLAQKLSTGYVNENAALAILEKLDILPEAYALPSNISTGQMQRAAIARAIINKPKILIADEPTSNLDDENANKVIDLLQSAAIDADSTLIVATHDSRVKSLFNYSIDLEMVC